MPDPFPEIGYIERRRSERLERVMKRLYTERRISGDEMRNLAQDIQIILDEIRIQGEVPSMR
jgi:hypothetical protein